TGPSARTAESGCRAPRRFRRSATRIPFAAAGSARRERPLRPRSPAWSEKRHPQSSIRSAHADEQARLRDETTSWDAPRSKVAADQLTSVASRVILALSSLETGQPALALAASSSNLVWFAPGHLGFQGQTDGGDGVAVGHLIERDFGRGRHVLGGELGLAENERQRHGEASGVCRPDEFLGIGAGFALEAAAETIGIVLERAALGRDRAFAVLDAALPDG